MLRTTTKDRNATWPKFFSSSVFLLLILISNWSLQQNHSHSQNITKSSTNSQIEWKYSNWHHKFIDLQYEQIHKFTSQSATALRTARRHPARAGRWPALARCPWRGPRPPPPGATLASATARWGCWKKREDEDEREREEMQIQIWGGVCLGGGEEMRISACCYQPGIKIVERLTYFEPGLKIVKLNRD